MAGTRPPLEKTLLCRSQQMGPSSRLPSSGELLTAVARLAAGRDGCPERPRLGFSRKRKGIYVGKDLGVSREAVREVADTELNVRIMSADSTALRAMPRSPPPRFPSAPHVVACSFQSVRYKPCVRARSYRTPASEVACRCGVLYRKAEKHIMISVPIGRLVLPFTGRPPEHAV
jgi:hypothetical protein